MATVQGTPEFSKYVDLRNGYEVGIHKFIVTSNGPLIGNTVQWNVKRMAPGTILGATLGLNGQINPLSVTVVSGTNRTTAQAIFTAGTINGWADGGSPHEVYLCTFHYGASNSSFRNS